MFKITKRMAAIAAAGVVAVGGAGAAYAAWYASGSGDTTATAATVNPLLVTVDPPAGLLAPSVSLPVKVNISNELNPDVPVVVETIELDRITVDDSHKALCAPTNLVFKAPAAGQAIVAGGSVLLEDGTVELISDAAPGCIGAQFKISVNASARVGS